MAAAIKPTCPKCSSSQTEQYGSLRERVYRHIVGKRKKWCCADCHTRFRGVANNTAQRKGILTALALIIGIALFLVLHGILTTSPKTWAKRNIVVVYKWVYGPEHRIKMHQHLSFLYDDVGDEVDDYQGHDY